MLPWWRVTKANILLQDRKYYKSSEHRPAATDMAEPANDMHV